MEKIFQQFLHKTGPVLCLDIGHGTQDVLLARPGVAVENWPSFVLPSPAMAVSRRLRELALLKKDVWLYGSTMGDGFLSAAGALSESGCRVFAERSAGEVLLGCRAGASGIALCDERPSSAVPVQMTDFSAQGWETILRSAGLPLPHLVLACVEDCAHAKDAAGRTARMEHFTKLLAESPDPVSWIMEKAPAESTRLFALQKAAGGPVCDTAAAAVLGAMLYQNVRTRSCRQGVTFVNVGNRHIVAALLYRGRVHGIYEHHTEMRTREELLADLAEFRRCFLPTEAVQASGGHGTAYGPICEEAGGYNPTFVGGPMRSLLAGYGQETAPFGSMRLAGPLGMLYGYITKQAAL